MIRMDDMTMSASCVVGVVNMDTRNAHKNPRKPPMSKIDFRKNELTTASTQKDNKRPRYGSEVNALDSKIGT